MDLFGTAGIRGSAATRVTPELALRVGRAAGLEAAESGETEFVLGRDGRTTGAGLAGAVESGLASAGVDVRRVGVVPTPALAFASRGRRGVMLTASHNPPEDNGLKLFRDGVEYDATRERAVEERADADPAPAAWDAWGDTGTETVLSAYADAVATYACGLGAPLDGLPVAVDCGNGAGGVATPRVLRALGARVISIDANVDGHFTGRESKPTPESLSTLREFVADGEFAFGVGHDGDADRVAVVDADGGMVHEDTVVAVLAERYVREADAADPVVVTTPNASARIDERVREAGGRVERVRLGALHEGIADARATGGDVAFAAEPWKHVHPAFGGWIDGVASVAVLARLVAEGVDSGDRAGPGSAAGLDALREPVTERPYRKVSVDCPDDAKGAAMETLEATLPERFPDADVDTEYGVRVERPDGSWVLVRPSGTEPYLRVYAESDDVDQLVATATDAVEAAVADAR